MAEARSNSERVLANALRQIEALPIDSESLKVEMVLHVRKVVTEASAHFEREVGRLFGVDRGERDNLH